MFCTVCINGSTAYMEYSNINGKNVQLFFLIFLNTKRHTDSSYDESHGGHIQLFPNRFL